jgi:hypothetical protein
MSEAEPNITDIIKRFREGAIMYHHGCFLAINAIQCNGLDIIQLARDQLDAQGPNARDALVPLLEDPDPGVRVVAAGHLIKIMPERAMAELEKLKKYCITEAAGTARDVMRMHKYGELDL